MEVGTHTSTDKRTKLFFRTTEFHRSVKNISFPPDGGCSQLPVHGIAGNGDAFSKVIAINNDEIAGRCFQV